jgi:thiol-disulfide isomerase/thioredoxin
MKNIIAAIALLFFGNFDFLEDQNTTNKRIFYFTASWCGPCKNFKDKEIPKLKSFGLSSSEANDDTLSNIEIYDIDLHKDFYEQLKKDSRVVPLFIFLNDEGIEYARLTGYQSAENIFKLWNQKSGLDFKN